MSTRWLAASLLLLSTCAAPQHPTAPAGRLLIVGGTLRLGAPEWRAAEALYAEDGRIVVVGSEEEARARAVKPFEELDLRGATALPGLIDAHGHLEALGRRFDEVDLRGASSYGEVIERVAARASSVPDGEWIHGAGWDQNLWPGAAFPHHAELSRRLDRHPVLLSRVDGHAILVNSLALERAGWAGPQASEAPLPGGRVLLDAQRLPTGVFVDAAEDLIRSKVPAPDAQTRRRWLLAGAAEMARNGLTAVHDMGEDFELSLLLAELARDGELPVEVVGYWSQSTLLERGESSGADGPAALPRDGGTNYRLAGVKFYMDGALGSRGAALLADYTDEPGNRGLSLLEAAELDRALAACERLGLQPAIHAIGDRANREVLDAFARRALSSPNFWSLRPRIEHAQVVAPADWARFQHAWLVPSMQPVHATSDMPWAIQRLGEARVAGAYAWRHLDPDGERLAFGSDFPVEACDPLAGVYAAITCASASGEPAEGFRPDQRLDARRALAAFTSNAARAGGDGERSGTLEVGRFANLTVLDLDPLSAEPQELLGGEHVRFTIVRGRIVYRAP